MTITQHIVQLLHTYDCVIIPGFGGFIANYKPAHIHPVTQKIYPPSKQISFNVNLKNNDGLLANKIAVSQNITYQEAVETINKWVLDVKKQLQTKGCYKIDGLGELRTTSENKLVFTPNHKSNFLPQAFGLSPIAAQPIQKTEKHIVPIKSASRLGWVKYAAAVFVGGMITSFLLFNHNDINHQVGQLASIISNKQPTYSAKTIEVPYFNDDEEAATIDTTQAVSLLSLHEREQPIVVEIKETKQDSTHVAINQPDFRFHIIAGCFSKKSNAKKLVKQLKKQGYQPQIISNYKNYHTVILQSFATKSQAKSFLPQVKPTIAHAWVLEWDV